MFDRSNRVRTRASTSQNLSATQNCKIAVFYGEYANQFSVLKLWCDSTNGYHLLSYTCRLKNPRVWVVIANVGTIGISFWTQTTYCTADLGVNNGSNRDHNLKNVNSRSWTFQNMSNYFITSNAHKVITCWSLLNLVPIHNLAKPQNRRYNLPTKR